MAEDHFETIRSLWNGRTAIHLRSDFYDLEGFRQRRNSLNPLEQEELGDVRGKRLLHLQCHFGQDTLSWAHKGATVTGVDLSDESIRAARDLSQSLAIPAEFICCNLYDLPAHLDRRFDIVFCSYGTVCWLPDLDRWAAIIRRYLEPGGVFYMADFHPILDCYDDEFDRPVRPYRPVAEPLKLESQGSYTDGGEGFTHSGFWWPHPLGEIVTALLDAGLRLEFLHELPYSFYNCFRGMIRGEDGHWHFEKLGRTIPLVFSLKAVRPRRTG